MPQLHYLWLKENIRVVKPGGIIIMTLQGDNYCGKMLAEEKELYDRGELVVRAKVYEGSRLYAAFHSPKFVKEKLLKSADNVELLEISARWEGGQDIWVLRKTGV